MNIVQLQSHSGKSQLHFGIKQYSTKYTITLQKESATSEIITPKDSFNYPDKVHSMPLFIFDVT